MFKLKPDSLWYQRLILRAPETGYERSDIITAVAKVPGSVGMSDPEMSEPPLNTNQIVTRD